MTYCIAQPVAEKQHEGDFKFHARIHRLNAYIEGIVQRIEGFEHRIINSVQLPTIVEPEPATILPSLSCTFPTELDPTTIINDQSGRIGKSGNNSFKEFKSNTISREITSIFCENVSNSGDNNLFKQVRDNVVENVQKDNSPWENRAMNPISEVVTQMNLDDGNYVESILEVMRHTDIEAVKKEICRLHRLLPSSSSCFPVFDGLEPLYWIYTAELFFECGNINNDSIKLCLTVSHAKGIALFWLSSLCQNNRIDTWEIFLDKFVIQYGLLEYRHLFGDSWKIHKLSSTSVSDVCTRSSDNGITPTQILSKNVVSNVIQKLPDRSASNDKLVGMKETSACNTKVTQNCSDPHIDMIGLDLYLESVKGVKGFTSTAYEIISIVILPRITLHVVGNFLLRPSWLYHPETIIRGWIINTFPWDPGG